MATASCPEQKSEVFIAGTEPVGVCQLHGGHGDQTVVSGWDVPLGPAPAKGSAPPNSPADEAKKKGLFGKIKDAVKSVVK
jgi:hypothetical protein